MCGQRQLPHLIKEEGSSVGRTKITVVVAYCARERALDVPKEFAINRALGNGAAVDGDVALRLAQGMVVNNAWNDFLTRTTFALDEDGQVGLCNLKGGIEHLVETRVAANNTIAGLNLCQIKCCHITCKGTTLN